VENDPDTGVTASAETTSEPQITPEPRRIARGPRFSILGGLASVFAGLLGAGLDILMVGLTVASAFVAVTLTDLPNTDVLKDVRLQEPLRVYSADGGLMGEYGVERRRPVSFSEIPPLVVDAFLATEDKTFFEHEGVDIRGIGRAAIAYLTTGERKQGGSTITMQVARNFFLTREKTFRRKLAELLLSVNI